MGETPVQVVNVTIGTPAMPTHIGPMLYAVSDFDLLTAQKAMIGLGTTGNKASANLRSR